MLDHKATSRSGVYSLGLEQQLPLEGADQGRVERRLGLPLEDGGGREEGNSATGSP